MGWQGHMSQKKEQANISEEQPSEMDIGNVVEREFRVKIVKMIQDLRKKKNEGTYPEVTKKCFNKT